MKEQLMREQFHDDDGKSCTSMREQSKKIIQDQGDVHAFELVELTDTIQCEHCHKNVTSGHIYYQLGRLLKLENT